MIQAATPSAETFMLDDIEINQVCVVYAGAMWLYHVMPGDLCWRDNGSGGGTDQCHI